MPLTQALMDDSTWSATFKPGVPQWFLDDIDVRTRAYATFCVTEQRIDTADMTEAEFMALVKFSGVYLGMGDGRRSIYGQGLEWWLGWDGEGGHLHAQEDIAYTSPKYIDQAVEDLVFGGPGGILANGLTMGTVIPLSTPLITTNLEGGDSRREMLDTIVNKADEELVWEITPQGVLNVNTPATLFPTSSSPTVILTPHGAGWDGDIVGLPAQLTASALDVSEVRQSVVVDWNDGRYNGVFTLSSPSTWKNFGGVTPVVRMVIDWRPKRPKPPTERWRRVAAWQIKNENQANRMAAREGNKRSAPRQEITAQVTIYAPWRHSIQPGDWVWFWDPSNGVYNAANELYYRGEAIRPEKHQIDQWTVPLHEGYGKYLRYWNGSSWSYYDLTDWVEDEAGPTTLLIGYRERIVRKSKVKVLGKKHKRALYRLARQAARLEAYLNAVAAARPGRR